MTRGRAFVYRGLGVGLGIRGGSSWGEGRGAATPASTTRECSVKDPYRVLTTLVAIAGSDGFPMSVHFAAAGAVD